MGRKRKYSEVIIDGKKILVPWGKCLFVMDVPDGDFCYYMKGKNPNRWIPCRFLLNLNKDFMIPPPYTDECIKYQQYIDVYYRKCGECKKKKR